MAQDYVGAKKDGFLMCPQYISFLLIASIKKQFSVVFPFCEKNSSDFLSQADLIYICGVIEKRQLLIVLVVGKIIPKPMFCSLVSR